jgi:hypothetical protein
LLPTVAGIRGHGAAWGDIDGDGWLDLYVGTFHTGATKPNQLFRNRHGRFFADDQPVLALSMRATGVVLADLDNDGDLDLYIGSMPAPEGSRLAEREGRVLRGCTLIRNDGAAGWVDVSAQSGACPEAFGGRSVAVLDFDGDGKLDLLVGEDPHPGYNGSPTKSSRLFHNKGDLQFEDVTQRVGIPPGIPGLGVAAADVNNDGWPDIVLVSSDGGNQLLVNDGQGHFFVDPHFRQLLATSWSDAGGDNMVCGVAFADVNRDGWLDMVIGQHYDHPWRRPVANRLYLNRGVDQGRSVFEDVTEACSLPALAMKAPHVEIQDFDNDGWPDIYQSVVKFADGRVVPIIFRHRGVRDGLPRFDSSAWAVNDFPQPAHQQAVSNRSVLDNMVREKLIFYAAPGPVADWDNDGRLDMFLPSWWPEGQSLLLRNETPSGNWLRVEVRGARRINRMGIGSRVLLYRKGKSGNQADLIGCREIAVGFGYASGQPAQAHFGLGDLDAVDVEVIFPHGKGRVVRQSVAANQVVIVSEQD